MFEPDADFVDRTWALLRWRVPAARPAFLDLVPGRGRLADLLRDAVRRGGGEASVHAVAQTDSLSHRALAVRGAPVLHAANAAGIRALLRGRAYDAVFLSTGRSATAILPLLPLVSGPATVVVVLSTASTWGPMYAAGYRRVDWARGAGTEGGRPYAAYFSLWRHEDRPEAPRAFRRTWSEQLADALAALEAGPSPADDASAFLRATTGGLDGDAYYASRDALQYS